MADFKVDQAALPEALPNSVDGRNPIRIRTTWKPWLKPLCIDIDRGSSFLGFLGGAGFRPSTVLGRIFRLQLFGFPSYFL